MTTVLTSALEHFDSLKPVLSPARRQRIEKRINAWQRQVASRQGVSAASTILFLTRPGAPPRPVSATLFTLKNDEHHQ
jgi:hypothetical protein